MGRLKAWIRGFFGFSRMESNAFLILLPLMVVIIFSQPLYRALQMRNSNTIQLEESPVLDSLLANLQPRRKETSLPQTGVTTRFTFFDPNTASSSELERLGLPAYLAARIDRYRKKGGLFRNKADLKKIYGMDSSWFARAEPWIRIAVAKNITPALLKPEKVEVRRDPLDINTCDSVQLTAMPGIGPVLSRRILIFRARLGGFHSTDQLGEVYGLDSAVAMKLKTLFRVAEGFVPGQIKLNQATPEDLMRHPYIRAKDARAIVAYRLQHGKFETVDQLAALKSLDPEWIEKVRPYLSVE